MNKKGFTLVELLVTMVILGIVTTMAWPVVTRIQENNMLTKYEKYGDAAVAAAKIYVDSYEEDLFYYEDDVTEATQNAGQCAFISYLDLKEHSLLKPFESKGLTCASKYTFVLVKRVKGKYTYKYYLGCGNEKDLADTGLLPKSKISFVLPNNDTRTAYESGPSGTPYADFHCQAPVLKS